jgi:hypothetical protein
MKSKIPFDPSPWLPGHKQQFRRFHQKDEAAAISRAFLERPRPIAKIGRRGSDVFRPFAG